MLRSIIPREELFFDSFEKICGLVVTAAEELKRMLDDGSPFSQAAFRIKSIENEVDDEVRETIQRLHKTFVTPFDRQDILKLTMCLDDILDMIEAVSSRLELYEPEQIMPEAHELTHILVQSSLQVAEMVKLLRHLKKNAHRILELSAEVNRLENEADRVHHGAVARLFREENDTRELIKWKDILEHIEGATDRCEDVSDTVDGILLENI